MFGFFKKKDDPFFGMLLKVGVKANEASILLNVIMTEGMVSIDNEKRMFHIEESTDEVYKEIIDRLNQTFITPIDREDIYSLTNMVEELVDMHENLIELMVCYKFVKVSEGIQQMAGLLEQCTYEIVKSMEWLRSVRSNKQQLLDHAVKIVALEDMSDKLYYREIARLFELAGSDMSSVELIKFRDVLVKLESMLNHCEKIAELFRGVVMKYA